MEHGHRGVNVNAQNNDGDTALHVAVTAPHRNPDILALLLSADPVVNVLNNQGATPLHGAASNRFSQGIVLLLDAGALTTVRDIWGKSPWDYAKEAAAVHPEFRFSEGYRLLKEQRFRR